MIPSVESDDDKSNPLMTTRQSIDLVRAGLGSTTRIQTRALTEASVIRQ